VHFSSHQYVPRVSRVLSPSGMLFSEVSKTCPFIMQFSVVCISQVTVSVSEETVGPTYRASFAKL
jgi:hypothetical protein